MLLACQNANLLEWPRFHKLYLELYKVGDVTVRTPLACALHDIAFIIDPLKHKKDLLELLNINIKDTN